MNKLKLLTGIAKMIAPRPLIFCGPSGTGKSTLVNRLMNEFPNSFGFCISHTTRKPRSGETEGVHYHYTTRDLMEKAIRNGEFIESATYSGNLYGTSKAAIQTVLNKGLVCILDIDTQGVKQVKKSDLQPHYVFVKPPSIESLKQRLNARNTETEESLDARLGHARDEIVYGTAPGNFDIVITNDDLEKAYEDLRGFITNKVLPN